MTRISAYLVSDAEFARCVRDCRETVLDMARADIFVIWLRCEDPVRINNGVQSSKGRRVLGYGYRKCVIVTCDTWCFNERTPAGIRPRRILICLRISTNFDEYGNYDDIPFELLKFALATLE